MAYNLRERVNHIGYCTNQIVATNNLSTIKQVLAALFYNLRRVSKSVRESAKLTIEECIIIWKKARIPTQENKKCVIKLEAEYERWRKIQRNASRRSDTQIKNEQTYKESINKLFDIACADALKKMEDESDKQFLLDQRGLFLDVITNLTEKELIVALFANKSYSLQKPSMIVDVVGQHLMKF
ncbi:uncharacterized protein LOC107981363 isoform X1 [Nasonia vitripennis]|uniref:Uncharacterized protein n=1 Tax=Nasonia vitripennis TaxID=7425 RepID=A0A7M7TA09_NASVI|nr:uncharacterized protein LOC107981363 isoform X1 [Nasonia vitripennis]XP_031785926.1 uncharacterized protein LOC107981363 isoform X1 [Nasonia vitripennis]XP_032457932.1 uncharacterized protein LOC107981363 isoform X1 [Nasonia vitripennis]